jgi:hypothetical protein
MLNNPILHLLVNFYSVPVAWFYGSSSHLMKNGQNFGILVLIWDLSGIDDTQT